MLIVRPRTQRVVILPLVAMSLAGVLGFGFVRAMRGSWPASDSPQFAVGLLVIFIALGYAVYSLRWFRRHGEEIVWGSLVGRSQRLSKGSRLQGNVLKGSRASYLEIWLVTQGLPNVKVLSVVYDHKAEPKARRIAEALGVSWQCRITPKRNGSRSNDR